jgi:diguanylate cyclase (GGDEF)-like protein/PAS domain S-box-containing protein
LFLVFIITLPGVIAIIYQTVAERNNAIEDARGHAVAVIDNITLEQAKIIENTHRFLLRLSQNPLLLNQSALKCSQYLANLLNLSDAYLNIGAPNADGQLRCNAIPLTKEINVSDRPYLQKAIKERTFTISQFQFDRAAEKVSINFAYPIIRPNDDKVLGAVVAVVSLDWWSKQLQHSKLPDNAVAYITDNNDEVIATYPPNNDLLGVLVTDIHEFIKLIPDQTTKLIKDENNIARVFEHRPLIDFPGINEVNLTIGIPIDHALNIINTRFFSLIGGLLFFILLSVLFAIYAINESVLKPLNALKRSAKKLEEGVHVDTHFLAKTKELIDLQNHFSSMAKIRLNAEEQLKHSQTYLQESEARLLRHLHNTPLGTLGWDNDFICTEWNRAAEKMFGYSAQEAIGAYIVDLIVAPELKKEFLRHYNLLTEQKGGTHFTGTNMTKNGAVIICNWYNTLILSKEGELNGFGCLVKDVTRDKRNQHTLNRFFKLPMNLHGLFNYDAKIIKVNKGWENILGYTSEELVGKGVIDMIHPDDIAKTRLETQHLKKFGSLPYFENRYITKKGETRLIAWSASASKKDQIIYAVGVDITQRRLDEDKLKLAAGVFTYAKEAIVITNAQNKIIEVNDAFIQISGFTSEEVLGKTNSIFRSGYQSKAFYTEMWQQINQSGYWAGEIWNKRKDGKVIPQLLTVSTVYDSNGNVLHYIAFYTDISAIKEHQKQLESIAHYDLLTGLPNRSLLSTRLRNSMSLCRENHYSLAVLFLDLDGFKEINDSQGHDIGDKLLVEVSRNMLACLREGDTLSRFGGDEFVAVLNNLTAEDCEPLLTKLLDSVSVPITINNILLNVSASIGVTVYPHDNVDAEQLLRHADQAMYKAKQEGKNRYHLFDMAQDIALKHQQKNLICIKMGLKNNEFVLHYQPKVNMKTGEMIGTEALIRWEHPELGLLPPSEFLPIIERHDLTIVVGEWVIATALRQLSIWQGLGLHTKVSINIEALQLQQIGFVARLAELLAAQPDVPANRLEIEVLETSELADVEDVADIMRACNALGVGFALDDFGTGYCSLTYLKRLPVDLIKIDQSFIRGMLVDKNDLSIVKGVIGLAQAFQRDVIAEGVETLEHGVALLELGCDFAQGYGIARPMPAESIVNWSKTWKPDARWV